MSSPLTQATQLPPGPLQQPLNPSPCPLSPPPFHPTNATPATTPSLKQLHCLQLPLDFLPPNIQQKRIEYYYSRNPGDTRIKRCNTSPQGIYSLCRQTKDPNLLGMRSYYLASRVLPFGTSLPSQLPEHTHIHTGSPHAGWLIVSEMHSGVFCLWALVSAWHVCPAFKAHHKSPRW